MTVNKFIRKLLNLKELSVSGFELKRKQKRLTLFVKTYKNGCRCPVCNRRGKIKHQTQTGRVWRELPIYGCRVELSYYPREIICPTPGRVQENIPWAGNYSRTTYRFEYAMLILRKFVRTIRKHQHRILPYISKRLTNAVGEGLKRIIKIVRNRASGYRTLEAFSDIIFLNVGDVDIPA